MQQSLKMEEGKNIFRRLEHLLESKGLKNEPNRLFNVDETEVQIVTQDGKALAKKAQEMCKLC